MKVSKVRELETGEIEKQLKDSDEQMFRLRMQLKMGQTEALKKYRELRKDRARMFTILGEKSRSAK